MVLGGASLGGGIAIFPHTIENIGNGEDSFDLTTTYTTGTAFDAGTIRIYADADANGVADNAVPITQTPLLAAGDVFGIVVQAQYLPTVAVGVADDPILVTTTSTQDPGGTPANDIVSNDISVINDAVIVTSKQISPGNGVPGEDLTITLTAATPVALDLTKAVCNDTAGSTAFGSSNAGSPGDVLVYRLTVVNPTSSPAIDVSIYDDTPLYTSAFGTVPASDPDTPTVLTPAPANCPGGGQSTVSGTLSCATAAPADGNAGYVNWQCTGSFGPGALAEFYFQVQIDP